MNESPRSLRTVRNYNEVTAFRPFDRYPMPISGVTWLPLSFDAGTQQGTYFLRLAPNSHPYPHDHANGEEFLLLHGQLIDESGNRFQEGDFVVCEPNAQRRSVSPDGAVLAVFIRGATRKVEAPPPIGLTSPLSRNFRHAEHYIPFARYGSPIPNVTWYPLTMDDSTGVGSYFSLYQKGASSIAHEHIGFEEFLVLEGKFIDNDGSVFGRGDFITYEPGSRHFSYAPDYALLAVFMGATNRQLREEELDELRASTGSANTSCDVAPSKAT